MSWTLSLRSSVLDVRSLCVDKWDEAKMVHFGHQQCPPGRVANGGISVKLTGVHSPQGMLETQGVLAFLQLMDHTTGITIQEVSFEEFTNNTTTEVLTIIW
eukprot:jgi/Chlat1/4127/Chrsp269S03952